MKVTYVFDGIDDEDDRQVFERASSLYSALWDIREEIIRPILRQKIDASEETYKLAEEISNRISESSFYEIK